MPYIDHQKITQVLNLIARKHNGSIDKLRAMKIVWAADRYHLRKYGRPVIGDNYFAVRKGPMASLTSDIASLNPSTKNARVVLAYAKNYISTGSANGYPLIVSKDKVDLDLFSETDIEALKFAYELFEKKPIGEVVEFIHKNFPEWNKFEKKLDKNPKGSFPMDYEDFFKKISNDTTEDPFEMSDEHLRSSKAVFMGD